MSAPRRETSYTESVRRGSVSPMSDADRLHPFTPDCQVRVLTEMCATCIFRPGNLMHLRRGRLATIVNDHQQADGNLICHSTLPYFGDGVEPALCRGHVDRYGPGRLLRMAVSLGTGILDVAPPDRKDRL
jgi:hypothetical protein